MAATSKVADAAPPAAPASVDVRAPVVRDLTDRSMAKTCDLLWPKEVDGVEYRQVILRRLSTGEVAAFMDKIRSNPDVSARERFPIFFDVHGTLLPDTVWDAFDPDDTDALAEEADAFLPARFKAARALSSSTPTASGTTGSSSDTPQASA